MKDNRNIAFLMPCKLSVPATTPMTFPGNKTSSLRRSHSLSQRPRLGVSEGGRSDVSSESARAKRSVGEQTTQFYVLQPKPGLPKSDGKLLQYPRPIVTLKPELGPSLHGDDGGIFTKHKKDTDNVQLSPKSILKNYTASSYRNPVLATRVDSEEEIIKQPSCLRSSRGNDFKGKQPSPRSSFRYRLSLTAPSSANDKKVTFDEQVSYMNDNNLYRRRHSTPSLPLL